MILNNYHFFYIRYTITLNFTYRLRNTEIRNEANGFGTASYIPSFPSLIDESTREEGMDDN